MSYILEALKKSEQERARGREQDLLTFPAVPPPAPALRPGVVLGLSALLLAGGIAIGWWQPWQRPTPLRPLPAPEERIVSAPAPGPDETATMSTPTRAEALKELRPLLPEGGGAPAPAPAKPSTVAAPAAPPQRPAAESTPARQALRPAAEAAPAGPKPRPAAAENAPSAAGSVRTEARPAAESGPVAEERMPAAKPPPARVLPPPPNRVLTLAELPVELREALPPLSIRGYVHSDDPTSRLVVVNDRMFREGEEVAADLKLERIDPDGIVLNFRGYRFVAPR